MGRRIILVPGDDKSFDHAQSFAVVRLLARYGEYYYCSIRTHKSGYVFCGIEEGPYTIIALTKSPPDYTARLHNSRTVTVGPGEVVTVDFEP